MSLSERRGELEQIVARALESLESDVGIPVVERAAFDFKEESGRRGPGGTIEPGERTNMDAAIKLADEVACFANTPGGGALIVGVENRTRQLIGTELDEEWLRHQIYKKIDVAPDVVPTWVEGARVLVIYVSEAPEPVENTSDQLRWRVGDHCEPVDRSEWWLRRESLGGFDPMGRATSQTIVDVTQGALEYVRRALLSDEVDRFPRDTSDRELLTAIGALRPDGHLTRAAALLLTPAHRALITVSVLSIAGGEVLSRYDGAPEQALIEQLRDTEQQLDLLNEATVIPDGFAERRVREIPLRAVREAILNGLIHRDWDVHEATRVVWERFDSTLRVTSPGGFTGGVSAENLLGLHHARYPALADLFRALRLVDKQGLGIDRMYQSMITLGHRPPNIVELPGPHVECTLVGGRPVVPIVRLVEAIRPEDRQRDVRVAVILYLLLHGPFVTMDRVRSALQTDDYAARIALAAAESTRLGATPLIVPVGSQAAWRLGADAFAAAKSTRNASALNETMFYATTDRAALRRVVEEWLEEFSSITTTELMELTGVSRPTASELLHELEGDIVIQKGAGRSSRYLLLER
ncbi:MAG: DUF5635 domain-containing protein [Leucobacter sp.]